MQIFHQLIVQLIFLTGGDSLEGKNFHEQVHFFNKTILKIFQNYVPKKAILLMIKIHRGLIMKLEKY